MIERNRVKVTKIIKIKVMQVESHRLSGTP